MGEPTTLWTKEALIADNLELKSKLEAAESKIAHLHSEVSIADIRERQERSVEQDICLIRESDDLPDWMIDLVKDYNQIRADRGILLDRLEAAEKELESETKLVERALDINDEIQTERNSFRKTVKAISYLVCEDDVITWNEQVDIVKRIQAIINGGER